MDKKRSLLYLSLLTALAFHGSGLFFTLEYTYDALIHLFFADHYATDWFSPWEARWYTGFNVQSYPPLVHQTIGLLSHIAGLKFGLYSVALIAIILFITGVYRFSLLLTGNYTVAGYATVMAVFSTTFIETLHIFGQLPSIVGLSVLLHSLPEIYLWIKTGTLKTFFTSISLIAVTVTSHHVTPIFGMIFFILPIIGMAVMDKARDYVSCNKELTIMIFWKAFTKTFKRMVVFGASSLFLIVFCILPYWINTKNNPITQVPIPHGSRDNFLEVTSSGLVFFFIPWGILLFIMPYLFYRFYSKRYIFIGLSLSLLTLLGTGGTTSLPLKILGENAFNILTLDRFTLWATIIVIPIFGEFIYRLADGDLKLLLQHKLGSVYHRIIGAFLAIGLLFMVVFTMSLGYFRPFQPAQINMLPVINFLNEDQHDNWRYLTLGFGDQMAWLAAQSKALTVDGNYHSARRLPELTSRAVERLENSKFRGIEGLGSLQQFLTVPDKYHLKYIFSNDKFYDPLLYFCGWQRVSRLDNGIMVWEKLNIKPLPSVLPKDKSSRFLNLLWGIVPLLTVIIAFILNIQLRWINILRGKQITTPAYLKYKATLNKFPLPLVVINHFWALLIMIAITWGCYQFYVFNDDQKTPVNVVKSYYDALDFKRFEAAYELIDPNKKVEISQFMRQISVTDGILSSYAKLDSISCTLINQSEDKAIVKATASWVTPLERINRTYRHELIKLDNKWYIAPSEFNNEIPPDQLVSFSNVGFHNHGRRNISTQQTNHEDVLTQPVLEILSACLVERDGQYSIIGRIQNVDYVPADVSITATLYNDNGSELAQYNAMYYLKHKLMPKETSVFRVDFEGVAWSDNHETKPATFNPGEFTQKKLKGSPAKFNLQCAGNVATKDLYKGLHLQSIQYEENTFNGTLFNSGVQEVTIPQLLISYYNKKQEMIWVDHLFLEEGVRVQRQQAFTYRPLNLNNIKVVNNSMEFCFVNGFANEEISAKYFPSRINNENKQLQVIEGDGFEFVKFEINNYIGNPK